MLLGLEQGLSYALIGGASGASNSIISRLLQRYLPTPLEKAQTGYYGAQVTIQREQLAHNIRQAERAFAEQRRTHVEAMELQRELDASRNQAQRDLEDYRSILSNWPLEARPCALLRAARGFGDGAEAGGVNSPASLNIIIKATGYPPHGSPEANGQWVQALASGAAGCADLALHLFGDAALLYTDVLRPTAMTGADLRATIQYGLFTEPTCLIVINTSGFPWITFDLYAWGWAPGGDRASFERSPLLRLEVPQDRLDWSAALERALLVLVAGQLEAYQALHASQAPRPSHAFQIAGIAPQLALWSRSARDVTTLEPRSALQLLLGSHCRAIEALSAHAPGLAAEAMAQLALDSQAHGDPKLTGFLLDQALEFAARSLTSRPESADALVGLIMRAPPEGGSSRLQEALVQLRGQALEAHVPPPRPSLEDLARQANTRLRTGVA